MAGSVELNTLVFSLLVLSTSIYEVQQVPCYYNFGDSLADNGNNNMLLTMAKVNYPPYGIDFPDGQTGRFTSDRTIVHPNTFGFRTQIPPFAAARGLDILLGVTTLPGRPEFATRQGTIISVNEQLQNHKITISRLRRILEGNNSTSMYLNKCLYTVGMGSNDFINNYFMPQYYPTSRRYTLDQYIQILIDQYSQKLRTLYTYGARKIALFALGQIGCTPYAISTYGTNGSLCVDSQNDAASMFNQKLQSLVDRLNIDLPEAKFTVLNPELSVDALIQLGLRVFAKECCQVSRICQCIQNGIPCPNRLEYIFWDGFHPTEVVNVALGKLAYLATVACYILPS